MSGPPQAWSLEVARWLGQVSDPLTTSRENFHYLVKVSILTQ